MLAKCVGKVLRNDIQKAAGTLQTCTGIDGGIEATIHAMTKAFHDPTSDGLLLVDATNAFNCLNRSTALANIKSICPPLHVFLNNCYKEPASLYVSKSETILKSREGTTQGDPLAMDMYALASMPLINDLNIKCEGVNVKQSWYADDRTLLALLMA